MVLHTEISNWEKSGQERNGENISFIYFALFVCTRMDYMSGQKIDTRRMKLMRSDISEHSFFFLWHIDFPCSVLSSKKTFMMIHSIRPSLEQSSICVPPYHTLHFRSLQRCVFPSKSEEKKSETTKALFSLFRSISSCIRNTDCECCWAAMVVVYRLAQAKDGRIKTSLKLLHMSCYSS